jgi:hypothetical protein
MFILKPKKSWQRYKINYFFFSNKKGIFEVFFINMYITYDIYATLNINNINPKEKQFLQKNYIKRSYKIL